MTNSSSRFEAFAPGAAVILLLVGAAGALAADMPMLALSLIIAGIVGAAMGLVMALRLHAAYKRRELMGYEEYLHHGYRS